MSTYLWIDLGTLAVPFLFSFHPRLRFHRTWPALWPALAWAMLLFIPWDAAFTRAGIWGFNPAHLAGPRLLGLPMEEWLFFLCIPYACVFTFHCLRVLGVKGLSARWSAAATNGMIAASVLLIVFFPGRAYTASAFGGLALMLLLIRLWLKPRWLGQAYLTWSVLLLPFLLVNGLLTGTLLAEPVVWYNDAQYLGVRIGTVPVEDAAYGLALFLLLVSVYEYRAAKQPLR